MNLPEFAAFIREIASCGLVVVLLVALADRGGGGGHGVRCCGGSP